MNSDTGDDIEINIYIEVKNDSNITTGIEKFQLKYKGNYYNTDIKKIVENILDLRKDKEGGLTRNIEEFDPKPGLYIHKTAKVTDYEINADEDISYLNNGDKLSRADFMKLFNK